MAKKIDKKPDLTKQTSTVKGARKQGPDKEPGQRVTMSAKQSKEANQKAAKRREMIRKAK